ncbi:MAG: ABC transporter ATP-binding protein [Sphingomonadales bacterium]|nr:ABC transporter ATP-binding protein [Sphingomonadales bacterium]
MTGGSAAEASPPSGAFAAALAVFRQLEATRRRQLFGTMVLMVLGAFAEMATIGAVLPLLAMVSPGGESGRYATLLGPVRHLAEGLGIGVLPMAALLLIVVAIAAAVLRLLLLWAGQNYVFAVAHDLSRAVYARVLHRPYTWHVMHNSSETLAGMQKVQFVLGNVLLPIMAGTTAAVVALFILAALVAIDPATSLVSGLVFGLLYYGVGKATRRKLYRSSDVIAESLGARVQAMQEGLGGIRDVLLDRSQAVFLADFEAIDARFCQAQATNQFIAAAPRFVVEAAGVVLIAGLAVWVSGRPGGMAAALPMLGALALGAQRLLPLVQQVYFSSSQVYGHRATLIDVAKLLDGPQSEPLPADQPAPFTQGIAFEHVGFTYPSASFPALSGINLAITRGARIGLAGKSGSGKSTFVDLLMGLLEPGEGRILVDGRPLDAAARAAWQAQVAHVPQAIFLSDGSIAANIAFGRAAGQVDMGRVREAARLAELEDFIATLPAGFDTPVGERGVRLSGGQRQRIGIARALYKQASVLVFDEATSALDDETEASVMAAIARLPRELTIVMIAHRLTTLRMCDAIVRLDAGRIAGIGPYDLLLAQGQGGE